MLRTCKPLHNAATLQILRVSSIASSRLGFHFVRVKNQEKTVTTHETRFRKTLKPCTIMTVPPADAPNANFGLVTSTAIATQQVRGMVKRRSNVLAIGSGSSTSGWVMVAARALLLLTGTSAFQLQPPISAPPGDASPFKINNNHRGCDLARRTTPAAATRRTVISSAATGPGAGKGGEESFAEDKRYRRKPKGANLRRDASGLPSEKVYAPRQSA